MKSYDSINSVSLFHDLFTTTKATHPLITKVHLTDVNTHYKSKYYSSSDLYIMTFTYNSTHENAILTFISPGQELCIVPSNEVKEGWLLCFHPDLIKNTGLDKKIMTYPFFQSKGNNSFKLDYSDLKTFIKFVNNLGIESNENIDYYSKELLTSYLENIFNYCRRYYNNMTA